MQTAFKFFGFCLALVAFVSNMAMAQVSIGGKTVLGRWKTIDDETGAAKSIVELYEENGKLFGRVKELFRKPDEDQNPVCKDCSDGRKNQPIRNMVIVRNMVKYSDKYGDGDILDPKKGKIYDCTLWLESADVLKVRGWWGLVYRTQTWYRVQ